jgi:cobalamin biosynthesis protein CobD/CbiB
MVLVMIAGSGLVGVVLAFLSGSLPFGCVLALIVILALISQHRPLLAARRIARGLERPGVLGKPILDYDHPVLRADEEFGPGQSRDAHAVARGAIAHLSGRYATGLVATQLNEAIAYIPLRLAGVLICLAAMFSVGARPARAFKTLFSGETSDGQKAKSTRGLTWPLSAAAGALGLTLEGPTPLTAEPGQVTPRIGPGDGRAMANSLDIRRAMLLIGVAALLHAALYLLVTMAWLAL